MLISYKWLKEFFEDGDLENCQPQNIADVLVSQGIEVASIKYLGDSFSNVVSAQIVDLQKHPNADKLSLCKVSDGTDEYQVICGAKNVFKGAKIAFAKIGAVLPGDFKINKAKLRDVESFGMICSEKELGLSTESEGIWILPENTELGKNIIELAELDDYIFEVEITPNRGDCLSVLGIAREIAAGLNLELKMPNISSCHTERSEGSNIDVSLELNMTERVQNDRVAKDLSVEILNQKACETYSAALIDGINISATPLWMKTRLVKAGLRSINLVVDITNYILLELGQPMHAFDFAKIAGSKIVVRNANSGEKIVALNNVEYKLSEQNLVIADSEKPVAIAGVIGGLDSAVDANTKTIIFESAIFNPTSVRKTAKGLAVSTDSSYRFERGVSWEIKDFAIKRAVDILMSLSSDCKVLKSINLLSPCHPEQSEGSKKAINLSLEKINKVIGKKYNSDEVLAVFKKLNFEIKSTGDENFAVSVPSHRNDISEQIDLIEEIVRIDGYKNIEAKPILISPFIESKKIDKLARINEFKQYFVGLGFFEAINYSFVSKAKVEFFGNNLNDCFKIINPLSETEEIMTPSRLLRLIDNAVFSFKRSEELIKLFEIGKCFHKKTNVSENLENNENFVLAGVLIGNQDEICWNNETKKVDFYYTKGVLNSFLKNVGLTGISFKETDLDFLDKNSSADVFVNGKKIGFVGKLAKKAEKFFDVKTDVFVFEINIDTFFGLNNEKSFKPLSCFPMVERDLSLIVKKGIKYDEINLVLVEVAADLLKNIKIFDVYEGEPIENGFKDISVRLYLQSEKETLADEKINILQNKILSELDEKLDIKLRP